MEGAFYMSHKKKRIDLWKEKYEFIKELGRGGNAKVFLVKKYDDDEQLALKSLENLDKEKVIRFLDEIQIMLDNYNDIDGIMPILDYSKEQYWYVMPVAKNIIEYIKENDVNYISITKGVIGLAETLSLLHKKGISHRDIKPANIYFYQNRFFFGDFGLVDFPDDSNDLTTSDRGIGNCSRNEKRS